MNSIQIAEIDWLLGRHKGDIFVKIFKNLHLRNHFRWMKMILCIHVGDRNLYIIINCVANWIRTLVVMATYYFHLLIIGKWKLTVSAASLWILGISFSRNIN